MDSKNGDLGIAPASVRKIVFGLTDVTARIGFFPIRAE
jgi:hypothetical protein